MLMGLIVGAALLPGPVHIGGVGFDIHTMPYASVAMIIGFQAILFAIFTKVFAISEGLLPEDRRMKSLQVREPGAGVDRRGRSSCSAWALRFTRSIPGVPPRSAL